MQSQPPSEPRTKEDWDFYLTQVEGQATSINLNLALRETAPLKDRPQLLRVRLHLRLPGPSGLSSNEEFESLNHIEDRMVGALQADALLFVGRCTGAGLREFFFYGSDPRGWESRVAEVMKSFADYRFEATTSPDPEWRSYLEFLYPNPEQMQSIQNRRVCLSLQQHGDPLTEPRPIDHFAYFPDEAARARFVERAKSLGFEPELLPSGPGGSSKVGVQLVRVDVPTLEGIDAITLPLHREALAQGGEYDGWGSPIPGPDRPGTPSKPDPTALKALLALFGLALAIVVFGLLTGK